MPSPLNRHNGVVRPASQEGPGLYRRAHLYAVRRGVDRRRAESQAKHSRQTFPRRPEQVCRRGSQAPAACAGKTPPAQLREVRDRDCDGRRLLHPVPPRKHFSLRHQDDATRIPPTGTLVGIDAGVASRVAQHHDMRALSSVFQRSMVMVIGPTPPGTGVMADATAAQDSKSASPTRR